MASQESDFRFQKTRKFWSSKADWRLRFSLPSIILADLLGNRSFLFKKVMVCDLWLADFDPFCAFLCFKVRCFSMIVMIIDDSEKRIFEGSVWTSEFACFWNTHTYISQPTPKIPLCSIILSCCVWISWWTPRTRSFLTCMVPFLRCLLSINKARAQSEQSPGAAKQTSAISQRATSSCYYKIKSDPPIQFIIWLPFFRPMRRQDNEKFEKYTVMLEEKEGQI